MKAIITFVKVIFVFLIMIVETITVITFRAEKDL